MAETRSELYIVAEVGPALAEQLPSIIARARPAALLLSASGGGRLVAATLAPLVAIGQAAGIATLIDGDAGLARTLKADGVHLPASADILAAYEDARSIVGTRQMVGAIAGLSRHDAMALGEAGADYVAFGIEADADDRMAAILDRNDMLAWWTEIFEPPCVAFDVADAEDARRLAGVGVDFLAVRIAAGTALEDTLARLAAISAAMAVTGVVA